MNGRTVNVYSTTNFKLIFIKNLQKEVTAISYSKDLKKILIGGLSYLVQILNSMTFEVEAESSKQLQLPPYHNYYLNHRYEYMRQDVHTVEYVPKLNIIVAAIKSSVSIYDTSLNLIQELSDLKRFGQWEPFASEIFALSKSRLLIPCRLEKQKVLVLFNLKTKTRKTYLEIFIPDVSAIEMTEKDHVKVFTSLVSFYTEKPSDYPHLYEQFSYKLTQMTFSSSTEELVVSKKTASPHTFTLFRRIEGSRFFLAQGKIGFNESREILIAINKEKIEIVKVILEPWSVLGKQLIMMTDGFLMVKLSFLDEVSVDGLNFQKAVKKERIEKV